jgi:predicted NBD/HSP70 family sugar kinase
MCPHYCAINRIMVQAPQMRPLNKSTRNKVRRLKIKQKAVANLEGELLRRVRADEGLSRVDLARELHLAPSTVGAYVDRLIAEGFLFEWQKAERDFGRPPTLLALNPKGGRFVGVDFEAHNIMGTVVDFSQQPLSRVHKTIRSSDSVEQIIGKIEELVSQLMAGRLRDVLGIGVGVPGAIDPKNQIALAYAHIKGWKNIPLGERLTKKFKVDVFLENNIRSMALAEMWFGQARGLENFVCLGIRTGIAAGIVVRRRVLHGKNNLAGEVGDWLCPVAPIERKMNGAANNWSCAGLESLEEIASVPAILKAVNEASKKNGGAGLGGKKGSPTFEDVSRAAIEGNEVVCKVIENVAQTLGWVVCQIDAVFNPQKVILAGSLVAFGETLLSPLRTALERFSSELQQEPPVVVNSELGEFNGALGAAALALHEWKPKR